MDGVRVVGYDLLDLVGGIVEPTIPHEQVDLVALLIVGCTIEEIGEGDLVVPAQRHGGVGHGLQVSGVGEHVDEDSVGLFHLLLSTQRASFLAQRIVVHLRGETQGTHISVKQLHRLLVATGIMRQTDHLVGIAQLQLLVRLSSIALGKHGLHLFVLQFPSMMLIGILIIPIILILAFFL